MKKTLKLLSAVLVVLTMLFITQTTTVSASENYKQLNDCTYYKGVSKNKASTFSNYTSAVPTDLFNVFKSTNCFYIVKSNFDVDADLSGAIKLYNEKDVVIGYIIPNPSYNSCKIYVFALAPVKDIKTAMYTAIAYCLDANYWGYAYMEPVFQTIFNEYKIANPTVNIAPRQLFGQYFAAYLCKIKLPTNVKNYYDALCNTSTNISTGLNTTAITGYENDSLLLERRGKVTYKQITDTIIYDTSLSESYIKQGKSWFVYLPQKVMDRFVANGWNFVFTDERLVMPGNHSSYYSGLCNYRYKVISIWVVAKQVRLQNILHEFGHFVDYTYSGGTFLSNNADFQALYEKYKYTYKESGIEATPGYVTSQVREFFATTFKDYILYGSDLKSQAPGVYAYMDNLNNTVLQ